MRELDPNHIPQPLQRYPEALVTNVYRMPGTEAVLDLQSQDTAGANMLERFEPNPIPTTLAVQVATGRMRPTYLRTHESIEVTRLQRHDERWYQAFTPKKFGAVVFGSMALFNVVGNADTLAGVAERAAHAVHRVFDPVADQHIVVQEKVSVAGKDMTIPVVAATQNRAGDITVNRQAIRQFDQAVTAAEARGGELQRLAIVGNTSDEWQTDKSIGVPSAENVRLGLARANAAKHALSATDIALPRTGIRITQKEHILTPMQKKSLLKEVKADGFPTIESAIQATEQDSKAVPKRLASQIKKLFTSKENRGVTLTATMHYPAKTSYKTVEKKKTIPGVDHEPSIPKPNWHGFIPWLLVPRFRRVKKSKSVTRLRRGPDKEIMRSKTIHQTADQVWLRTRPEAVKPDGTMVENPATFTSKLEYLYREGRLADLLRADFNNSNGEAKTLRTVFVDYAPIDEHTELQAGRTAECSTIAVLETVLKRIATVQDGKLADRIKGIYIYPSENAGTKHGDPKRVALGMDKQRHEHTLGTYTPILDYIELHMPTSWDPESIEACMASLDGALATLAHESMHAAADNDAPLRLRRIETSLVPNAYIIDGDSRSNYAKQLHKTLRDLPTGNEKKSKPVTFDITYNELASDGATVSKSARVTGDDPRLARATSATIVGFKPTRYAAENAEEHGAEVGAVMLTGIVIPFSEAGVTIDRTGIDQNSQTRYVDGYLPDIRDQALFAKLVGAIPGSFPAEFPNALKVTFRHMAPENDPVIRETMLRTRNIRSLRPEQMVSILARVTKREHQ